VNGTPRLERVWNLLDDLEKITGAGAEAFWLRAHQGYVAEIDKDTQMDADEQTAMRDHIEEFAHQIRRTVGLRGVNFKALGADTANFGPNVDAILTQIAGGSEIPKRILTGSEQGELASSQDTANWNTRVQDRRNQFAAPMVVRQTVDRFIELGALPKPEQYEVRWPKMRDMSDAERAAIAQQWASINYEFGGTVVTAEEIRDRVLDLPPLKEVAGPPQVSAVPPGQRQKGQQPPGGQPQGGEPPSQIQPQQQPEPAPRGALALSRGTR
jgi:hypothetical protein